MGAVRGEMGKEGYKTATWRLRERVNLVIPDPNLLTHPSCPLFSLDLCQQNHGASPRWLTVEWEAHTHVHTTCTSKTRNLSKWMTNTHPYGQYTPFWIYSTSINPSYADTDLCRRQLCIDAKEDKWKEGVTNWVCVLYTIKYSLYDAKRSFKNESLWEAGALIHRSKIMSSKMYKSRPHCSAINFHCCVCDLLSQTTNTNLAG